MTDVAELIEKTFIAHASQIAGIKSVMQYEPGLIDRMDLPAITLYFLLPEVVESETGTGAGPGGDFDWRWEVKLYVALTDWKEAQRQTRTLAQEVLTNFMEHKLDYDSQSGPADLYARTLRRRTPPTPDGDVEVASMLISAWELQVTGSILDPTA